MIFLNYEVIVKHQYHMLHKSSNSERRRQTQGAGYKEKAAFTGVSIGEDPIISHLLHMYKEILH